MSPELLKDLENDYTRRAYRVEASNLRKPKPSSWLPVARDAFKNAAAAIAQARNTADPIQAELIRIAEAYAEVGDAAERIARAAEGLR